ncbi:hypothetical protein WN55_07037 [Dufourea novaeangliae]|uniref:Uncharacterized protein n=1 Tax=Dufourea novaeangliae TaxID=178035 RepID=A0A154PTB1_DUFNO|nr:hypothetical protein WN55_07037 [Dufourea novaeangliae]
MTLPLNFACPKQHCLTGASVPATTLALTSERRRYLYVHTRDSMFPIIRRHGIAYEPKDLIDSTCFGFDYVASIHQALYQRPLQRMSSGEAPPAKTIPRVLDGALLSSVLRDELIGFGLVLRSMKRPKLCWNHYQNHKAAAHKMLIAVKSGLPQPTMVAPISST